MLGHAEESLLGAVIFCLAVWVALKYSAHSLQEAQLGLPPLRPQHENPNLQA